MSEKFVQTANMKDLAQRNHDLCDLDFLKTMDDIMGGGDTVVRFRERYKELTGKKVRVMGDPMNEEKSAQGGEL
ncbi:MAG: hypothetical protein WC405_19930 [Syntrophales bacterium]